MLNIRYPSEWIAQASDVLARVAEKPWALFLLLLSVNALAQPYWGITHDARLYSVQVLNYVEEGTYADDLFFRYGSQDEYSLFSRLAAPLVRALGLSAAFFVMYMVSKSLLIFGIMRIVQTLVPNRATGVLAMIYATTACIYYGGHRMLKIQENFLTPRLLACALVLIGLDLLLRRRPVLSFLAVVLAAAVHPLMAFGGLLIWAGYCLWHYLGARAFIAISVTACVAAAVVLAVEPWGKRCFGEMDDTWRQNIILASSFNFPSYWARSDWYYLGFQLVILGIGIWKYWSVDAAKARFLSVLMIVTVAGAIGAVLAEQLPYALFQQGQSYRALWILAFLHLGIVFWLCIEWSQHRSWLGRLAGCALLAYLCSVDGVIDQFVLAALLFPVLAVAVRGLDKEPQSPDWLVHSLRLSLVLGGLGWAAYKFLLLARGHDELLALHPEHRDILDVFLRNLGPIVFSVALCWLLVRVTKMSWNIPPLRPPLVRGGWGGYALTAVACVGWQTCFFALPDTDFYREHCTRYRADLRKVHERLHRDRGHSQPLPTVYCNLGCVEYVWVDLHAKSYFDWWQAGNYMFRREMAVEGQRRARMVGPLAIAHYRTVEQQMAQGEKDGIARLFQTDFKRGPVTKDDLTQLCQEPSLDYLVLQQPVEGLDAEQIGRLYVYSCRDVRAALGVPELATGKAVALGGR